MVWDGIDRRHDDSRSGDHDVLTRIDANLSNFMRRFDDHTQDDIKNFTKIDVKANVIEERIGRLEKALWVAVGGATIIFGVLKLVVK